MVPCAGYRDSKQLPTSNMRVLLTVGTEWRDRIPKVKDDSAIEFLAFRFVHGHYVDASQVAVAPQDLVLGDGRFNQVSGSFVSTSSLPYFRQIVGNASPSVEAH